MEVGLGSQNAMICRGLGPFHWSAEANIQSVVVASNYKVNGMAVHGPFVCSFRQAYGLDPGLSEAIAML